VKTIAKPLLFDKKKDCSFSSFLVYVKVSPVAEENLAVCSCSSESIGLLNFLSGYFMLFPNLVDPDFADGANLIYFPPSLIGLPLLLSGELYNESLYCRYLSCSAS
jgi:hypothetical protein